MAVAPLVPMSSPVNNQCTGGRVAAATPDEAKVAFGALDAPKATSATRVRSGDRQLGGVQPGAAGGDDRLPVARARQGPQRPGARCREEPEVARRRRDDLRGELARAVEQTDERTADGLPAGHHATGEHGL